VSFIGVDIGGTNTRVGLLTADGALIARRSAPTRPERGNAAALETLVGLIESLISDHSGTLDAIGVAVTGPVDLQTGIVDNPYTLRGWGPTNLVAPLRERFGVTVQIENDANAAALGEWWQGAGQTSRRLAVVTIGTGIGVGLLVDGHVQRRPDGSHGEAGHHVLDPNGPQCYCGARGCWEILASGPAVARTALSARALPLLAEIPRDNHDAIADAVITAALNGEPAATQVLDRIAQWIGLGLVNLIAFFMPDTIVLGGGVGARCFNLMAPTITSTLEQHQSLVPTDTNLAVAQTGDDAGLLGAALRTRRATVTPKGHSPGSRPVITRLG
jgi:glucokinase